MFERSASVIIPCWNEQNSIPDLIDSLSIQNIPSQFEFSIIFALNGCTDQTCSVVLEHISKIKKVYSSIEIIEIADRSKTIAINAAERIAPGGMRIYMDADISFGPDLLAGIVDALDTLEPKYGCAKIIPEAGCGFVCRSYAKVWRSMPRISGVPNGIGVYAVNQRGRERWEKFPKIIADDKYVRLQFRPSERLRVDSIYKWPMPKSIGALLKSRMRWHRGSKELIKAYPQLQANEDRINNFAAILKMFSIRPVATVIFALINIAALSMLTLDRRKSSETTWFRSR